MGLIDDVGAGPVGLDTAIFIYFIEEHPTFLPLVEPLFDAIDGGHLEAVTSELTLLEVLVVPYGADDVELAGRYETLLTNSRGLRTLPLERALLRAAARLRSLARIKTPDALQVAAALSAGCTAFITNDRTLPAGLGLDVLELADYRRG